MTPKLHGITNFYEWRCAWEQYIDSLAKLIDPIIKHYHLKLINFEKHKVSVFERYKEVDPKMLKRLGSDIDYLLQGELQKTIRLHNSQHIIGPMIVGSYLETIDKIMLLEELVPNELKAAEAYSFRKRKVILADSLSACREHDAVYEPDWVVEVVARSVDVTKFLPSSVAELFNKIESRNLRERYRQLAKDNVRISKGQRVIEETVREICLRTLNIPEKPGFKRNKNKRNEGRNNKRARYESDNGNTDQSNQ